LQRSQNVHMGWIEHRLSELEEAITGRKPEPPED
jgi:hypothetical protein